MRQPILLLLLPLSACFEFNAEQMFQQHALPQAAPYLTQLQGEQLKACLQCPIYFKFHAPPEIIQQIIRHQQLAKAPRTPAFIPVINHDIHQQSDWWPNRESVQDTVYWRYLEPKIGGNEPAYRILMQQQGHWFFISSGPFHRDYYQQKWPAIK